jgi:polygalacturonase
MSHERPVENVLVTNCLLHTRWAAIRAGGAHRAGTRNVTVSNCVISQAFGCGIKLQVSGNASLENMAFSNLVMRAVSCPISLRFGNAHYLGEQRDESFPWGGMRNLMFNNIFANVVDEATLRREVQFPPLYPGEERQCMSICGLPGHPVEGISLSEAHFIYPGGGTRADAANLNPPELEDQYPEYFMWGVLPAYGLYARHARALALDNVRFELRGADARPAVVCDDVEELSLSHFRAGLAPGVDALVKTRRVPELCLHDCRCLQDQAPHAALLSSFD